ncbi:MAG: transposase, partial [Bdellovibrionales bacterium]|nr:transposase [Bdellovibrionales bacterium]
SIHAGVHIKANDRAGREKLIRYAARPPFSEEQLRIVDDDRVELTLRSPTKAGQRTVMLTPVQFLRRLAWLIPPPHLNMIRYYGVFGATHKMQ